MTWQNQQNGMCAQWRLRSAWADQSLCCLHEESLGHIERTAKTLIRLGGCPCWSESSLGAHDHSKDCDQTGWMPMLIWVFTRRTLCWFCHEKAQIWHTTHTRITMHYIRPFLYDIIKVSSPFSQCYFTKCIGYNTNCIIGVIMKSNTIPIATSTLHTVKWTKL